MVETDPGEYCIVAPDTVQYTVLPTDTAKMPHHGDMTKTSATKRPLVEGTTAGGVEDKKAKMKEADGPDLVDDPDQKRDWGLDFFSVVDLPWWRPGEYEAARPPTVGPFVAGSTNIQVHLFPRDKNTQLLEVTAQFVFHEGDKLDPAYMRRRTGVELTAPQGEVFKAQQLGHPIFKENVRDSQGKLLDDAACRMLCVRITEKYKQWWGEEPNFGID